VGYGYTASNSDGKKYALMHLYYIFLVDTIDFARY
jgi:hypothetical protein